MGLFILRRLALLLVAVVVSSIVVFLLLRILPGDLAQAIGGIVHDLGNPLTAVQMGAETLTAVLDDPAPDPALLRELAAPIADGAQMLNALRLSLIEQVRALERAVPADHHEAVNVPRAEVGGGRQGEQGARRASPSG